MRLLKTGQTAQPLVFLMVDSADHLTGKTGLTPTVTLSKNGGAFASPAGAVTEIAHGWYKVAGNATDTNTLGPLVLHATSAGADPVDVEFGVVAYDPQDTVRLGLTALPNAAAGANNGLPLGDASGDVTVGAYASGQAPLQPTTAGRTLDVSATGEADANVVQIGGDTQSATDLKDFADAGYDPAANKVEGVKLVDTVTTLTGHTPQTGDAFARLGAPAGASVSADVAAIKSDTAAILDDTGTSGVVLANDAITSAKIAADAIGSSELAASAVSEIQSGLSTLDAAGVRTAVGLASANLDTQLAAIDDAVDFEVAAVLAAVDTEVAAIKAKTDNLPSDPADQSAVEAALTAAVAALQTAVTDVDGYDLTEALKLILAACAGEVSGAPSGPILIRAADDSKVRITAQIDGSGNRTSLTLDETG